MFSCWEQEGQNGPIHRSPETMSNIRTKVVVSLVTSRDGGSLYVCVGGRV